MFYIYVLLSSKFQTRYVGSTDDIHERLREHNLGKCRYTKGRKPWQLIYQEKFISRGEAMKREKFLKSGRGRKYLDSILK